jgi:hypothetical protein
VRRLERRRRLADLAAHPGTNPAVARRIRFVLSDGTDPHPPAA